MPAPKSASDTDTGSMPDLPKPQPRRRRWPRPALPDLLAGLSLAGLLLPEAVAYASIANLPPQAAVIALFAGLVCYGLLGTSRFAVVSATSSSAAVLAAASATVTAGDSTLRMAVALGLVLTTGVFFTLAGIARLGNMSDFIAKPVMRGFAFGLAIVIILKQLAGVVGIMPRYTDMFRFSIDLFSQATRWNLPAIVVAAVALLLLYVMSKLPRVPGGLVVIVLGIAAGKWLDLSQYGIALVGAIDLQLALPSLPVLTYPYWLRVGELAVAMAMILYAESYSSIRNFAIKHGDAVSSNRDLFALGIANIVSGLFQGMPVGAGFSATAANEEAGAVSRWSGWVAALTLLAIVLALLPAIALTPVPVLAAIVIHAVGHTVRPVVFRPYFTWHRDRIVIVAAVIAVLSLGVLDGLLAAMGVSVLMLLRRLAESSVTVLARLDNGHYFVSWSAHPEARPVPGILILRPDTGLFFANAERMLAQVRRLVEATGEETHTVILSLEASPDLDSTSIEALSDCCAAIVNQGKQLLLARLKTRMQQVLTRAAIPGLPATILRDLSVDDAVTLARSGMPKTRRARRIRLDETSA